LGDLSAQGIPYRVDLSGDVTTEVLTSRRKRDLHFNVPLEPLKFLTHTLLEQVERALVQTSTDLNVGDLILKSVQFGPIGLDLDRSGPTGGLGLNLLTEPVQ